MKWAYLGALLLAGCAAPNLLIASAGSETRGMRARDVAPGQTAIYEIREGKEREIVRVLHGSVTGFSVSTTGESLRLVWGSGFPSAQAKVSVHPLQVFQLDCLIPLEPVGEGFRSQRLLSREIGFMATIRLEESGSLQVHQGIWPDGSVVGSGEVHRFPKAERVLGGTAVTKFFEDSGPFRRLVSLGEPEQQADGSWMQEFRLTRHDEPEKYLLQFDQLGRVVKSTRLPDDD